MGPQHVRSPRWSTRSCAVGSPPTFRLKQPAKCEFVLYLKTARTLDVLRASPVRFWRNARPDSPGLEQHAYRRVGEVGRRFDLLLERWNAKERAKSPCLDATSVTESYC